MARKTETTITLRVSVKVPEGSNASAVMDYVRAAINSHCGGIDPEDPIFNLDRDKVTVSLLKKETVYG